MCCLHVGWQNPQIEWEMQVAGIHQRSPPICMLLSETGEFGGSYFELQLMLTSAEIICPLALPLTQSQEGVV